MVDYVIYDSNCNLCATFVQLLWQFDQGERFNYLPMQDIAVIGQFGITPTDCELGMYLINGDRHTERWQGSAAAEEIARRLPLGNSIIQAYRELPGMKALGDKVYEQVRDNRYDWFGKRNTPYHVPSGK